MGIVHYINPILVVPLFPIAFGSRNNGKWILIGNYLIGLAFVAMSQKKRSIWPTFSSKKARHACRLHAFPCNLLRKVVLFWTCNMPFDYVFSDCVQCCKLKKALKMLKNFFYTQSLVKCYFT